LVDVAQANYKYSKRTGLEKAIYQIEEAVKKSKTDSLLSEGAIIELQRLLGEPRDSLSARAESRSPIGERFSPEQGGSTQASDEQLALDDAENPLQLLARATDLRPSTPQRSEANASTPSSRHFGNEREDRSSTNQFFQPVKACLDGEEGGQNGQDSDPIEVGLVTIKEAEILLSL
jgi:hypothetical protein